MVAGTIDKFCIKEVISTEQEPTEKCCAMVTTDPKCNYILGSKGTKADMELGCDKEVISTNKVDYNIVKEETAIQETESDTKELMDDMDDKRNSMSYMSVNCVEEGVEWYRQNFPKVPDDLLLPMARWSFGDLSKISRRAVKNDKKRTDKGKKGNIPKFEVKTGNYVIEF